MLPCRCCLLSRRGLLLESLQVVAGEPLKQTLGQHFFQWLQHRIQADLHGAIPQPRKGLGHGGAHIASPHELGKASPDRTADPSNRRIGQFGADAPAGGFQDLRSEHGPALLCGEGLQLISLARRQGLLIKALALLLFLNNGGHIRNGEVNISQGVPHAGCFACICLEAVFQAVVWETSSSSHRQLRHGTRRSTQLQLSARTNEITAPENIQIWIVPGS